MITFTQDERLSLPDLAIELGIIQSTTKQNKT